MVEWSISLQPQEELAAFARFGNAVASLCVEKKGARACLKNHFRNLQAPLYGIFCPHSVAVARYAALIRTKSPTKWDSQLAKSLFQTRSRKRAEPFCFFSRSVRLFFCLILLFLYGEHLHNLSILHKVRCLYQNLIPVL